jgi:T-complex protein 1 subunit delta
MASKAAGAPSAGAGGAVGTKKGELQKDKAKEDDVRTANIIAAKAVADAVRTSLGPRGMDKMIEDSSGNPIITNDGATILSHLQVFHPTAKMLVELSKSQDIEAGDGTTSVVVLCGSLLDQCGRLLSRGIHPTAITEAFQMAVTKTEEILCAMAEEVELTDREKLVQAAVTSLSSKVVKENSERLAPLAVDAVLSVAGEDATNVDLRDIKIVKALGGTTEETELVPGLAFIKRASHVAGAPTRMEKAKVGLIQFCLSAPKTDMENSVVVSDYEAMDRILREERKYILQLCKKIKKAGCNVLLVQKSILRDAVNDLSLHFLSKMGIMVVTNVEREDVEFISKTIGCKPVAHVDSFAADKLGSAELVEEVSAGSTKVVKVTGVPHVGRTCTVLVRGSNQLVLDETDRSLHDALCVVRSLVKKKYLIVGAGAPEVEVAQQLTLWSKELTGMASYCVRSFADALEVIPYTLAENAGMHPLAIVTELRKRHREGHVHDGINVRRGTICDIREENVYQPLLVSLSAIALATETVNMILKIDDMVAVR